MSYFYEVINTDEGLPVKVIIHSVSKFDMHWHNYFEIIMVLEGSILIRKGEEETRLKQGDIIVLNRNEVHSLNCTDEKNLLIALQIDVDFYALTYPNIKDIYFKCNSAIYQEEERQIHYQEIRKHIASIVWQLLKRNKGYRANIGSYLYLLEAELLNASVLLSKSINEESVTDSDLKRLQRIIDYVNDNIHKKISLADLCKIEHLNYYYLSHFIRGKLGISFQEYVNHVRLDKATRLLMNDNMNITDIAYSVGFASTTSFNKVFKEKYKLSPSEFRKAFTSRNDLMQFTQIDSNSHEEYEGSNLFADGDITDKQRSYLEINRTIALKTLFNYLPSNIDKSDENTVVTELVCDFNKAGTKLTHYWKQLTTFSRAAEGLRSDWQKQFIQLQDEIGFSYVRFHGIFSDDMMVCQRDLMGQIFYNWTYVDTLFDFLLQNNIRPFVELGFMPKILAKSEETTFWWKAYVAQPKEMEQWVALVKAFVTHCINRYGIEEVAEWYFEVWNEPELRNCYWIGDKEDYFVFYHQTALAIKTISARLRVGGPAVSHQVLEDATWLDDFLKYCKKHQVPLDIVTFHVYPEYYPVLDIKGLLNRFLETESLLEKKEIMASVKRVYNGPNHVVQTIDLVKHKVDNILEHDPELFITEWNASAFNRNLIHDTTYVAAYIIKNVVESIGKVKGLGYWTFTDIHEELQIPKQHFFGGFGLINKDGLKKPSYYAFYLLNKLGNLLIDKGEGYIITKNTSGIQILLYNYIYFDELFMHGDVSMMIALNDRYSIYAHNESKKVCVRIEGITGQYKLTTYRLNRLQGSVYDNWLEMGAPEDMSQEEVSYLDQISRPDIKTKTMLIEDIYSIESNLSPHGIELITLNEVF